MQVHAQKIVDDDPVEKCGGFPSGTNIKYLPSLVSRFKGPRYEPSTYLAPMLESVPKAYVAQACRAHGVGALLAYQFAVPWLKVSLAEPDPHQGERVW